MPTENEPTNETPSPVCPGIQTLIDWVQGDADLSIVWSMQRIELHVFSCSNCQRRLQELTDEESLTPPNKLPSFTNEPHFKAMQKRIAEQVSRLANDESSDQEQ